MLPTRREPASGAIPECITWNLRQTVNTRLMHSCALRNQAERFLRKLTTERAFVTIPLALGSCPGHSQLALVLMRALLARVSRLTALVALVSTATTLFFSLTTNARAAASNHLSTLLVAEIGALLAAVTLLIEARRRCTRQRRGPPSSRRR